MSYCQDCANRDQQIASLTAEVERLKAQSQDAGEGLMLADPGDATPTSSQVCVLCGAPAEFINGWWRHKEPIHTAENMAQIFCDKRGYPIEVQPDRRERGESSK